ncbi:MAG: hypothetical protein WCJ95_18025 [Mariniphaga sp.]
MKTIFYSVLLAVTSIFSCQPPSKPDSFDPVAQRLELIKTLEQLFRAHNTRNIQSFLSVMADDGLFCGRDSKN